MRRLLGIGALVLVVGAVVLGLSQAGGNGGASGAPARFDLRAAMRKLDRPPTPPAPLVALHEQSNTLLGGGEDALRARLKDLRGLPVVINKWASWCSPCRAEFPIFQHVATQYGRRVAFLGLDAQDKAPAAKRFLSQRPLPYPSYEDPDQSIARSLEAPDVAPVTVFIDAHGKTAFIHSGQYTSSRQLSDDIDRYLMGA
jgi:thiol-disulfide isomerase/thioredoxin